jgi:spore germination protein
MTPPRKQVALIAAVGLLLVAIAGFAVLRPVFASQPRMVVAATWPWWDPRGDGSLAVAVAEGPISEISPMWAVPTAGGGLDVVPPGPAVESARSRGVRLLPTVQNYIDREWDGDLVAGILADPVAAERHRRLLVDAVVEHDWTGVDIDYGDLPPTAGSALVDFLTSLREDLHAHGKELSVTVPARTADEARSEALAYSYQRLGAVADQLRVRAHYHAWDTSEPGPVAPVAWVEDVARYAVQRVPRGKLMLGIATYGYDWADGPGVELQTADAVALARQVGAEPRWDEDAAAHGFSYRRAGEDHTVWYEDARSAQVKYAVAVREGLRGVTVWRLGGEDPGVWGMTTGDHK